ncbi:MAG TPA: HAMP domain-containing sensor histidine kinase [Stellaceae bacterium]|jgi:signal transduction histidine kinase|nr:HAMP domain-containing sensor histidine kinase [Stellaceae bacterium]
MTVRKPDLPYAAALLRRHGTIAALAMLALAGFVALAAMGIGDGRDGAARAAQSAIAGDADRARAIIDRERAALDRLAMYAATASDAAAQHLLDGIVPGTPGRRGAALADGAGMVQLRARTALDETALAALAANAARLAETQPQAALLVTQTLRDGDDAALVGLARPWFKPDGSLGGVALIAIDRTAFPGLDVARADGSPLFAADSAAMRDVALGDLPLLLRYAPPAPAFWTRHGPAPLVALAVAGILALLGLLAVLSARLAAADRDKASAAAVEQELRERLADSAQAAGRIDELSRTKSQFFAQVTHELRTPLNAILGFSETIRQEMFGPVANPRYREYAGLIHDAGAHLLSLINDLLDEARIESGKMEIAPIRVSAPALARSALDLVELLAEGRDIALATNGLSSCPDLNVDARAMKQVLVNLLSNAIKYTPPGGRIELRCAAHDDGAVFEIADTGIGMSEEDIAVAFEPFGRAGGIEARRQQGTGLGLSLARALVRLHGGDLTLSSHLDDGTTAIITLPPSAVFPVSATEAARAA